MATITVQAGSALHLPVTQDQTLEPNDARLPRDRCPTVAVAAAGR